MLTVDTKDRAKLQEYNLKLKTNYIDAAYTSTDSFDFPVLLYEVLPYIFSDAIVLLKKQFFHHLIVVADQSTTIQTDVVRTTFPELVFIFEAQFRKAEEFTTFNAVTGEVVISPESDQTGTYKLILKMSAGEDYYNAVMFLVVKKPFEVIDEAYYVQNSENFVQVEPDFVPDAISSALDSDDD